QRGDNLKLNPLHFIYQNNNNVSITKFLPIFISAISCTVINFIDTSTDPVSNKRNDFILENLFGSKTAYLFQPKHSQINLSIIYNSGSA
ncbi:hypothetical protein CONCODRAFT_5492, partial [Conidiobolus coronatus NRRL 28638]